MQIAYAPDDATRIIGQNKLAVILGVEVDSLGNWRRAEDLAQQAGGDADQARVLIAAELDWLYGLGIRQITPIHLATNAFGGTAIYLRFLELSNVFLTGKAWEVEDAFATGVRYRLDQDSADLVIEIERRIAAAGPGIQGRPRLAMNRHSLIDTLPGLEDLADKAVAPDVNGAAGLPGPRFGAFAAYGANTGAIRIAQRRGEIDRQRNGVRYDRPLRDYRWFRCDDSGPGAYDDDDRDVWQVVAEYKAGFDPSTLPLGLRLRADVGQVRRARPGQRGRARLAAGPGETGHPLSHIGAHNPKSLDSLGYNCTCADWGAKEDLNGQAGRPVGETPG